jgi:hypothetical protein
MCMIISCVFSAEDIPHKGCGKIQPVPLMITKTSNNDYYLLIYLPSTSRCNHKASTVTAAFYGQIILHFAYNRKANSLRCVFCR